MILRLLIVLAAAATLMAQAAGPAAAHSQSYAFVTVDRGADATRGRLELAVRDLDTLFGLDGDGDGAVTWGELRRRESAVTEGALAALSIASGGGACRLSGEPLLIDRRGGESYAVIGFAAACPMASGDVTVDYRLMFDRDAQHRALVALHQDGETRSAVLSPQQRRFSAAASEGSLFLTFVAHGIHHILIGYDHILFVITLLLGSVAAAASGRQALAAAVKVVTAFTLTHSLTLGLAAGGLVTVPAALTESLIAATIVLAAVNNIFPVVTRRIWLVASLFGLVHGLGFANVLADLALPAGNLLVALLAFNGGVELGQLAIVLAGLPALLLLRAATAESRTVLRGANAVIAAIGVAWFADRAAGLQILPF